MTSRDRYLATLLFREPDRVPLSPGAGRKSTRQAWHEQGLPRWIDTAEEITEYAYRASGGREPLPPSGEDFPLDSRMIPRFEEKVLERGERTQIVRDWKGNVCEIGADFDVTYLRTAVDFVTRRWIRCPVETRADWRDMARRYDPADPARLASDALERAGRLRFRDWPVKLSVNGPFWQLREWLGFEKLCMMFYDDPGFVREMVRFWEDFVAALLERAFGLFVPDEVYLSEDMAFKGFSMISPAMAREFLLPTYRRWGRLVREAGVPVFSMDSDGFIGELIPIWMEAGINVVDPIEVAAGNDIADFRARFAKGIAFRGGVDKRAIAKGGAALEAEMARLLPVIRGGGYVPGCDHGVPPDVPWGHFVKYVGMLARATGWL